MGHEIAETISPQGSTPVRENAGPGIDESIWREKSQNSERFDYDEQPCKHVWNDKTQEKNEV